MGNITTGQFLVMKSPCCVHLAHTECFKTWGTTSHTGSNVHCAYCRIPYPHQEVCFLCLETKDENENLSSTNCCQTTIHSECTKNLIDLLSVFYFDHTLECGQLTYCNCLWIQVSLLCFSNSYVFVNSKYHVQFSRIQDCPGLSQE